jgi:hypothetical protein
VQRKTRKNWLGSDLQRDALTNFPKFDRKKLRSFLFKGREGSRQLAFFINSINNTIIIYRFKTKGESNGAF